MTTQIEAKIEAILEDYRTWKQHLRKILEKHLKKEKEKLEADQKYNEWLKMNWYNEADFIITTNWTQKIMRKKISLIDLS